MHAVERLPRTRNGRPRLCRTDDVTDYWAERIALVAPERELFSYSSMICEGDRLFHYGRHFELARIIRDKRGRARLVLLNGDSYSGSGGFGPSTSSRQRDVRGVASRTDVPSLVVPFSALEGAGIDFDSIMPIHVRDDRFTTHEHSSRKRPADLTKMPDPSGATRTEECWHYNRDTGRSEQGVREVPVYVSDPNETIGFSSQHGWSEGASLDEDGVWRWTVRRHWLGDSIFRARLTDSRTRKATVEEMAEFEAHRTWAAEHTRLDAEERRLRHIAYSLDDRLGSHGRDYRLMTRRMFAAQGFREAAERASAAVSDHRGTQVWANGVRNGRMPIRVTRWATYLSSFDYQEPRPLYFLCELPYGAKPSTVEEAVEVLKPPEVVAALARGLHVIRQGDLFAIPTKLTKRQIRRMARGREFEKRLRVLGTNHSVTEGIVLKGGAVLGRGIMRHEPEGFREPDHKSLTLGDNWHLLVRNTVPRTR